MKVYFVRHGESETNCLKCWSGWLDVSLTDKGREDAEKAKTILENVKFDKVFSSDLKRAKQTAEIILPGVSYSTTELIREISVGSLSGTPSENIPLEERLQLYAGGYSRYGGESVAELHDRIGKFMKQLEELDCENVAVFAHKGCLTGALKLVLERDIPRDNICCNNCTVAIFEYTDKAWKLYSWINVT